ncbi:Low molecular weight protein tyrosine phosphatase [hydrothermal vent metagenome]|uniref:protein-tyrosine-phosphatase n=1 Tax=hydrothermal vent metagenome TaxID=652676 RepID=A0A3B0S719_9ZZZZ
MARKILFVCLGNICRSPTAEAVFESLATGAGVDSAGTSGWHINEPPYGPMQHAAKARGYDMSNLRARQFVAEDFDRVDLIIGMDADNLGAIEALRPLGNTTPVHLFTDYADGAGMDHIPDPYYTRDFDGTLDLIELAAEGLAKALAT